MNEPDPPDCAHILRLQSSLYDILWPGGEARGGLALRLLGYRHYQDVGRYRDAWIEQSPLGALFLHVYTRNGGANRADYTEAIQAMRNHPWFQRDEDDPFESTYASFYFLAPPDVAREIAGVAGPPVNTAERWKTTLGQLANDPAALPDGVLERCKAQLGPLFDRLRDI